jgi:hypothetical protein
MELRLARLNALLRSQELRVQLADGDRSSPIGDGGVDGVVIFVQAREDVADEFLRAKWLTD